MVKKAASWLEGVPLVWKAAGALALAAGTLIASTAMAVRTVDAQRTLPARVRALEVWKDSTAEPGMRFLICSQRAINQGVNPQPCEAVLQTARELMLPPGP